MKKWNKKPKGFFILKENDIINIVKSGCMEKKDKKICNNAFINKLVNNKLYFFSFVITLIVAGYGVFIWFKSSDGLITKRNKQQLQIIENIKKVKAANDGFYSHRVTLNKKIEVGTCTVSSYEYVFEVKNGIFTKYFSNDCLGVIKLEQVDGLEVNDYSFTDGGLRYDKDTNITTLIESENSSVNLYFYTNSIVLLTDDDLVLIGNNKVNYINSEKYSSSGGNLSKRYYESSSEKGTFNFIVFYNDEDVPCYEDIERDKMDDKLYDIYQIHFNSSFDTFDEPRLLISRTKGNYCINYENDINILKQ